MLIAAIALGIAALIYFLVTTLVPLRPLNNLDSSTARERRTEVAVNAPILLSPAVLLAVAGGPGPAWLAYLGASLAGVIVLSGLALWWLPYLVGVAVPWATAGTDDSWPELHARTYAKTIIVLPRIGDRPRPNLEHMILHALMIAGTVTAFIAAAQLQS